MKEFQLFLNIVFIISVLVPIALHFKEKDFNAASGWFVALILAFIALMRL